MGIVFLVLYGLVKLALRSVRRELADHIAKLHTAADHVESLYDRCEKCEERFSMLADQVSDNGIDGVKAGLDVIKEELRIIREEQKTNRLVLKAVTNEFSNTTSRLLGIVAGRSRRDERDARDPHSTGNDPGGDSGEWFVK